MAQPDRPSVRLARNLALACGARVDGLDVLTACYEHMAEMVVDRGYTLTRRSDTAAAMCTAIDDGAPVLVASRLATPDDGEDAASSPGARRRRCHLLFFVDGDERTSVKWVRSLRERYADADAHLVVASAEGPTPFAKREMSSADDVEFWFVREFLLNPTRHALVPRHEQMRVDEVVALQRARCIADDQWPQLLATDIVARWHAFPKHSVVRIHREGFGVERGYYYRKVV